MDIRQSIASNGGFWLSKFGEIWKTQVSGVQQKFGKAIQEVRMPPDYPTEVPILIVEKDSIVEILKFLKEEPGFEYGFLSDITATDEKDTGSVARFEVVYQLFSLTQKSRIRIKVRVNENEEVPTATPVWKGANWAEREVYDMFGIQFKGHPDLRRILMDYRWVGHPLRKDYPLKGYQIFTEPEQVDPTRLE